MGPWNTRTKLEIIGLMLRELHPRSPRFVARGERTRVGEPRFAVHSRVFHGTHRTHPDPRRVAQPGCETHMVEPPATVIRRNPRDTRFIPKHGCLNHVQSAVDTTVSPAILHLFEYESLTAPVLIDSRAARGTTSSRYCRRKDFWLDDQPSPPKQQKESIRK